MGRYTRASSVTPYLVLPQSLKIVYTNAFSICYLFTTIVYCGSFDLSTNSSDFNLQPTSSPTEIMVTENYEYLEFLGTSNLIKNENTSDHCYNYVPKRTISLSRSPTQNREPLNGARIFNRIFEKTMLCLAMFSLCDLFEISKDINYEFRMI